MYTLRLGKSVKALCGDYYEIIQEMVALGYHSIDIVLCECGFENTAEQVEEVKREVVEEIEILDIDEEIDIPVIEYSEVVIEDNAI